MSAGTGTEPNLGLAPSVEHLIAELETVRDIARNQSDSKWVQDLLPQVAFERCDPCYGSDGIMALMWGRVCDNFTDQTLEPVVTRILTETHQKFGIPGSAQNLGNGKWLFRWDDQG